MFVDKAKTKLVHCTLACIGFSGHENCGGPLRGPPINVSNSSMVAKRLEYIKPSKVIINTVSSITVSSSSIRKYNVGLCGTVHEEICIAWAQRTTSIYSIGVTVR